MNKEAEALAAIFASSVIPVTRLIGAERNAKANANEKIPMKILNIPVCAYCVQILTPSFDFSVEALLLAVSSN